MDEIRNVLAQYGLSDPEITEVIVTLGMVNLQQGYFSLLPGRYGFSGIVQRDRRCYGFIAVNKGTAQCQVNNILLFGSIVPGTSGESFSYVDPLGRYYNEDFQVTFIGAGTQDLQLVQVLKIVIQ